LSKLLRLICCLVLAGLAACARIDPPESGRHAGRGDPRNAGLFPARRDTASGYEHDLVTAFADSQGLKPKFIQAADPYELNDLALAGRVHLAASMPLGNEPCSSRPRSAA
jgi:hypothetical protein